VVQDIRKFGFDVLLMLEATIGLNEVNAKESENAEPGADPIGDDMAFTQNDLSFLRSLRISVQGEEEDQGEDVNLGEEESRGKEQTPTDIDED